MWTSKLEKKGWSEDENSWQEHFVVQIQLSPVTYRTNLLMIDTQFAMSFFSQLLKVETNCRPALKVKARYENEGDTEVSY